MKKGQRKKDRDDCALMICFRGKNQFAWQTLCRTERPGWKSPLCKPALVSPQIKKGRKPEFILRTLSCLPSQCKQPSPLLARLGGFPWPLADWKASHTENCCWQKIRKKECLHTFIYFICDCTRQGETVNAKYFILDRLSASKRVL